MGTLFLTKEAGIYNGAKTASSINGAGKTGQLHCKRMKLEHFLTPYEKAMATHSSTLAWKIPWTEETGRLSGAWDH